MIYDEKASWLRREDGSLAVHVDEIEDGRVYFDFKLKGMTRVSMLEIEEIIALGGRDYAAGRRAGIEEAAKSCDIAGKVAHLGMVADICAERIRALPGAKT